MVQISHPFIQRSKINLYLINDKNIKNRMNPGMININSTFSSGVFARHFPKKRQRDISFRGLAFSRMSFSEFRAI